MTALKKRAFVRTRSIHFHSTHKGNSMRTLFLTVVASIALPAVAWGQATIAYQGFEASGDTWAIIAGSGNISGSSGAADFPANQRIRTGLGSWQVVNGTSTLEFGEVSTVGFSNVSVSLYLSSTSLTSGNGSDGADSVRVFVALNGSSFSAASAVTVHGNNNARWGYTAVLTASGSAGTYTRYQAPQGGTNTNNYSKVDISIPDGTSSVALKVIANNNDANEVWSIDDVLLAGTLGAIPSISVSQISLPSFGNVNVGSTSGEQSYTVSGSDLSDDILVTPPTGFEISTTSGSGFGNSLTLSQSGGVVASTAVYVRFSPGAAQSYSGDITHESAGASTKNVAVSGTGVLPIPFQVVFHETMGSVSGTTFIGTHATANGFDNDDLSFSGTADLRSTAVSSGYSGASGGANVFFTTNGTASFEISGINTTGLMALELSFGILKTTTGSDGSDFIVEVSSDTISYSTLPFPPLPTGSGTATWHYRTATGSIPAVGNLRIRFRQTGTTTQYRIDDVLLRNTASAPTVNANGSTNICEGQDATLTSSAAATYLWSTGATTQSITVSEAGRYSVTVTDKKGNSATSSGVDVTVTLTVAAAGEIAGPNSVTPGQTGTEYSVSGVSGATEYTWTVPDGASIESGQGSTSITVNWGSTSGNVTVTPSNSCFNGSQSSLAVTVTAPPSDGSISGTVGLSAGGGVANVLVKLLEEGNDNPVNEQATDSQGRYSFADLAAGNYDIMIVEPLGFTADAAQKSTALASGGSNTVDFTLTPASVSNDARGIGYWKHQFDVYITNRGAAQESPSNLTTYISRVHQYYTPHFDLFDGKTTFADWQGVLTVKGNAPMAERAKQQLGAFVLNLVSSKISQLTAVAADGRTAGDALTYVSGLLADGIPSNDESAKNLAEMVNTQQTIPAGVIPAGGILYKGGSVSISWMFGVPDEYVLHQNYPNPFNPSTTIPFDLPQPSKVRLSVFDPLGRELIRLVDDEKREGRHEAVWTGRDGGGRPVASGLYFIRLEARSSVGSDGIVSVRRLILLK
jgi:hypothetical protein